MDENTVNRRRRSGWLLVLTLALAAFFLYLAVRRVDWAETLATLRQGNLALLGLVMVVFTLSCITRALRWRVLLSAEKQLPLSMVFWSMMVGYLGNSYLPARAGEVIRAVMVGQRGGVSKSFALATALTERIADAVILVAVSAAALSLTTSLPEEILQAMRVMAAIGVLGAVLVFLAPRMSGLVHSVIRRLPLSAALREKLDGFAGSFLTGAGALQHAGRLLQFSLFSVVLWSLDTVVGLLLARSFGLSINPAQIFILLAALGIASAIPSTPGYVGVYQFVAVAVLVPFGLSNSQAIAYILAFQGMQYLGITFWGLLGLLNLGGRKKEAMQNQGTPRA
jgi:uncharacterized protein (TIRG00374 family)